MQNQIAQTIIAHLGASRFIAMTGASLFISNARGVYFQIPASNALRANRVIVELNAADEYTVTFYKSRGVSMKPVKHIASVQAAQLREAFSNATGLAVSL